MAKINKSKTTKQVSGPSMRDLASTKPKRKKRAIKKNGVFSSKAFGLIKKPFKGLFKILGWIVPPYFKNAWKEIRQVTWPGRKETIRLTIAVFIFSTVFAVFVAGLDYVLEKIFKTFILQ